MCNKYGYCPICGEPLQPSWFIEEEINQSGWKTGRKRRALNYLYCDNCDHKETVDDSFDGPWY